MATFKAFTVVKVPFPFTDRQTTVRRPALVLSNAQCFNAPSGHVVLAMITSTRQAWPLDTPISDLVSAGLPSASSVRLKLFTLDARFLLGTLGHLADTDRRAVQTHLSALFSQDAAR